MIDTLEITPIRLSDMVAERIADAIMDGTIPAGSRVRDNELAQQLGVSRMPVREALQRLQRVGLIETAASRYTRVTKVTPELVRSTLEFSTHYTISVLRMALVRMTEAQREEAARRFDDIIGRLKLSEDGIAAEREVQDLLLGYADNAFITGISADLGMAIQRNLLAGRSDAAMPSAVQYLENLRDAVRAGDADAGERIIRAHSGVHD